MIAPLTVSNAVAPITKVPWLGPRIALRLHHRFGVFGLSGWEELTDAVVAARPAVVSLDVFDTVVVRDLAGDQAIEVAIDRASCPEAADDLERRLCRAAPGAVDGLARIRTVSPQVVFLSDTDRSSALLTEILSDLGLLLPGDEVVASCEVGATKSDGDLFGAEAYRCALARAAGRGGSDIDPSQVWHVGNNPWADGVMALRSGFVAAIIADANPNRYEQILLWRPGGSGPALAAAARMARLQPSAAYPVDDQAHPAAAGSAGTVSIGAGSAGSGSAAALLPAPLGLLAYEGDALGALGRSDSFVVEPDAEQRRLIGVNVAGPALVGFALWVADQCRRHRLDHVVYLARDGELPLRVAKAIPADHWEGRGLSYLHSSRMTWALAAASRVGVGAWLAAGLSDSGSFLRAKQHEVPLATLIGRIGLEPHELSRFGPAHQGMASLDPEQPLPVDHAGSWVGLLADDAVMSVVAERSDARRRLILDRLDQRGFPRGRVGLVDVGWRGRLAWQVSAVLDEYGTDALHLHFGGDKVVPDVDDVVPIERFAFDGLGRSSAVSAPVSCVETLTASGRPRVVAYQRRPDGRVVHVFDDGRHDLDGARCQMWAGALSMASCVASRAEFDALGIDPVPDPGTIRDLLARWWNEPVRAEARAMGSIDFEHDEAGTTMRPLIAPYGLAELVDTESRRPRQWREGSAVVTAAPLRWAVGVGRRFHPGADA